MFSKVFLLFVCFLNGIILKSFPFKRTSFFSNFGYLYSLNTRLLLFFQFLSADESHQPPSLASTLPFPGEDLGEGRGDTKRLGWEDRAWMG